MKPVLLKALREKFRRDLGEAYPQAEIDVIFSMLAAHFFGLPRTILAMEPGKELQEEDALLMLGALGELCNHRPVQYIIGRAPFMEMDLQVSPAVLIPRPETAELVDWILEEVSPESTGLRMLDIGTGSGCIALALKKCFADAEVHALDLSKEALGVARSNALEQQAEILLRQADVCNPGSDWPSFDLVVSNPPYVPLREQETMAPHVRDSEPHMALFASEGDPLEFYRCICHFAAQFLKVEGQLFVEIHKDFGGEVVALFREYGFGDIVLKKDIFGRDRFVRGRWKGSFLEGGSQKKT